MNNQQNPAKKYAIHHPLHTTELVYNVSDENPQTKDTSSASEKRNLETEGRLPSLDNNIDKCHTSKQEGTPSSSSSSVGKKQVSNNCFQEW